MVSTGQPQRLAGLARPLDELGGVWMSVRARPFGRGALARFWLPTREAADAFRRHIPTGWETTIVGHLRTVAAVSYDGCQVVVTVPWSEIAAARDALRALKLTRPELAT